MSLPLILAAAGLFVASGIARGRLGPVLAAAAALSGIAGAMLSFRLSAPAAWDVAWAVPGGRFSIALDGLGAAFLLPVFVVPALGTLYGHDYFPSRHPTSVRTRLAYGILPASMVLIVLARNAILFLVAWEVMALCAFFLVSADDHDPAVRESGWVYLVATHLGTLCLVAAFAILARTVGTLALEPVRGLAPPDLARVGLLFLVGFGVKAGLMPLHFWLPGAHANAPSHVSAVMSGVVLNMGVYGLMRMSSLLPELPASAGGVLLTAGAASAVVGAALALAQADVKRLLAYSSVDNMAIVIMALGLALVGRATGRDELVVLGVAGAVWHVWNHALFKSLLFFAAGSIQHATGTRRLDHLGGLACSMPVTAGTALVGSLALAGLPPLNGFFSELVVYVGLARSSTDVAWPALAVPALALTGALAVAAMVKVYGGAFLGEARLPVYSHDPPAAMRVAMVALAGACAGVALGAFALGPVLDRVVAAFALRPMPSLDSLVPLGAASALTLGAGAVALALVRWTRRGWAESSRASVGTWDCGYAMPSPRIQYTPTSFAELATELFRHVVGTVASRPWLRGVFPGATALTIAEHDPVLDRAALPTLRVAGRSLTWLRRTQQGKVQAYVLYVVIALLVLLWIA